MRVLGKRLLVRQLDQPQAVGPIWLAPAYKPEQFMHEVVAVGSGVKDEVKPGDHVYLDQYRLTDRTQAGDGNWIVSLEACCLLIPAL